MDIMVGNLIIVSKIVLLPCYFPKQTKIRLFYNLHQAVYWFLLHIIPPHFRRLAA